MNNIDKIRYRLKLLDAVAACQRRYALAQAARRTNREGAFRLYLAALEMRRVLGASK